MQIPTNFLVFKTLISARKIQKQVILYYKNALFSPSTQIKEIPYKNSWFRNFFTESNVFILFTPNWLLSYFFCRVKSVTASQWLVGKAEVIWGLATTGKCVYIVPYIYWIILEYNSLRRGAQKDPQLIDIRNISYISSWFHFKQSMKKFE